MPKRIPVPAAATLTTFGAAIGLVIGDGDHHDRDHADAADEQTHAREREANFEKGIAARCAAATARGST